MEIERLQDAAIVLRKAKLRRRKDDEDYKRNDSIGNQVRAIQSLAFYNGVVETLSSLGLRQEVEQESVREHPSSSGSEVRR